MKVWEDLKTYSAMIRLEKSGMNIFYLDTIGENMPACVLLHGLADEADTWRHVIPELSRSFRILAPDLPGFGRSDKPSRTYTMDFLKDTLLEFLDALDIQRAHFIGSSLGAMLIQYAGLSYPERMISQILADGVLVPQKQKISFSSLLFLMPLVGEFLYSRLKNQPVEAYKSLNPYYADLEGMPRRDRDFLHQRVHDRVSDNRQRHAYFSILRRFSLWLEKSDRFRDGLSRLELPVLLIWGEMDRVLPASLGDIMASLIPGAKMVTIPGSGHLPHQESPDEFLGIVTPWLIEHSPVEEQE